MVSYYGRTSPLPTQTRAQPNLPGPWLCSLQPAGFTNKPGKNRQKGEIKGMLCQRYSLWLDCWGKKSAFSEAKCCSWSRLSQAACEVTGNNYKRPRPGASELLQQKMYPAWSTFPLPQHPCREAPKLPWLPHPPHLSAEHNSSLCIHPPTSWLWKNSCRSSLQQLWAVILTPEEQTQVCFLATVWCWKTFCLDVWCQDLEQGQLPFRDSAHERLLLWEGKESLA